MNFWCDYSAPRSLIVCWGTTVITCATLVTGCAVQALHGAQVRVTGIVQEDLPAANDDVIINVYINLANARGQYVKQGPLVLRTSPESERVEATGILKWCTESGPFNRPFPESITIEIVAPGQPAKELQFPISEKMMTNTMAIDLDQNTIRFE